MKRDPFKTRKNAAIKAGLAHLKEQKMTMAINEIKRKLVAAGQPVPPPKRLKQIAEANLSINTRKK